MQVKDVSDAQVFACFANGRGRVWDQLETQGVPSKVAMRKLEQWEDRGWVEVGVSLATCWLSDAGHAALYDGAWYLTTHGEGA